MAVLFFGAIWVVAALLSFLDTLLKDFLNRG